MTHTRSMNDDEGTFSDWSPAPEKCPKCDGELRVYFRIWESNDGAYEDRQYRCWDCKPTWWIDGIDS